MDPALLAGVDDDNDEDTSFAGVHGNDTSLARVPIPTTTIMTNDHDETPLTPMRPTKIQAKHPYTAPEATYQFTVQLVNHHKILQMRKSWTI